jgi:hypothetical protein
VGSSSIPMMGSRPEFAQRWALSWSGLPLQELRQPNPLLVSGPVRLTGLNLSGFTFHLTQGVTITSTLSLSLSACGLSSLPSSGDSSQAVACYSCKDEFMGCVACHREAWLPSRSAQGWGPQRSFCCRRLRCVPSSPHKELSQSL